jgi:hypothetical protein
VLQSLGGPPTREAFERGREGGVMGILDATSLATFEVRVELGGEFWIKPISPSIPKKRGRLAAIHDVHLA